ncbi:uncharacterized protein LOC135393467 isoform X2 [Ornithodoros turicata]|uniref:uncharacterized protein LOC135393467 isoform X2 n=1 Tax=Ornithodoros turicata TaxID=34597 RepID=UPI003138F725
MTRFETLTFATSNQAVSAYASRRNLTWSRPRASVMKISLALLCVTVLSAVNAYPYDYYPSLALEEPGPYVPHDQGRRVPKTPSLQYPHHTIPTWSGVPGRPVGTFPDHQYSSGPRVPKMPVGTLPDHPHSYGPGVPRVPEGTSPGHPEPPEPITIIRRPWGKSPDLPLPPGDHVVLGPCNTPFPNEYCSWVCRRFRHTHGWCNMSKQKCVCS